MKFSGRGGYWVIDPPPTYDSNQNLITPVRTIVHNAEYEVLTENDIRQTRSIGCLGWSEGLPRYRRVERATFRVAEDDASYPQVIGFTEGSEVSVFLKRGSLFQFDYLYHAIVQSVRRTVEPGKAVWVEIVCQHGALTRGVAPPFSQSSQIGGQ